MKKERLFWILTAALALAMGFVPELGSGLFALCLPSACPSFALLFAVSLASSNSKT